MADRKNRAFPLTPADEICISGMGGRFPKATGLYELRDKLYNKVCPIRHGFTRSRSSK